jgi:hypothetical protein
MSLTDKVRSGLNTAVLVGSMALLPLTGCYTSTTMYDNKTSSQKTQVNQEQDTRSFVGRPAALLHHSDGDLEFELESYDEFEQKNYKINIYEDADKSNIENLNLIRSWIKESLKDTNAEFRVEGFYDKKREKLRYEEGNMNPFAVIRLEKVFDDSTWKNFEEVAWTDGKDSKMYNDKDENTIIIFNQVYTPGHSIWHVHYPIGFYPRWDVDGDGIPNRFDPWPTTPGPWFNENHNHMWDWYDPYYPGVYWNYWGNFWGYTTFDFIIPWRNHYDNHHHHDGHKYKDRHNNIIRIRNDFGGRNPGIRNPGDKNPRFRDPFLKDPKLIRNYEDRKIREREIIKDRDPLKEREIIRNRDPLKEKDSKRERDPIINRDPKNKDLERRIEDKKPPIRKEEERKQDTYKPEYNPPNKDKEKKQDTYKPQYTPPKRETERKTETRKEEERRYVPPKENTPREYTPRNETPKSPGREYTPPRNNPPRTTPPQTTPPPKSTDRSRDKK